LEQWTGLRQTGTSGRAPERRPAVSP
jgi:hypothetical protein